MRDITVVWDWNGTLLDDVALNWDIMNRMLFKRGKKPLVSLEAYRRVFGFPIREYYERAGFDFLKEDYETVAGEYMSLYRKESMDCRLFRDVEQALSTLSRLGVRQALLSASQRDCLLEQLDALGVRDFFDPVLALSHCLAHSKIELAEEWMQKSELRGESLLLIGDTLHDYEVAKRLGGSCILIAWGHQDRKRLSACGCPVADSVGQAVQWLITAT